MSEDLSKIDPRFNYSGARSRHVRFPLGGIGSGGFSIAGSGRLVDWSIRNRPNLQSWNGYTHFAIKAEAKGKLVDARVLNGPYDENPAGGLGLRPMFDGFGHGAMRQSLAGVPHCEKVDFYGRFPSADLVFTDKKMPARVRLTAFSPFIPHDDRTSSMPVAMMAFEITNTSRQKLDFTLAGTLANHGVNSGLHSFHQADGVSTMFLTSADAARETEHGNLAIATDAADVEHQDYHFRGQWFDDLAVFWKDFARAGRLPPRHYDTPRKSLHMAKQPEHATLGARVTLSAGQSKTIRFVISWSFPHGDIYWAFRRSPDSPIPPDPTPQWKNYYATQWPDAKSSAIEALKDWAKLQARTFAFRDALFGSTQPPEITEAASATLALLRTATVIRLEDGTLWGWEGQHTKDGSCEGSCTHVWNYQQALSHLFPALERTLRDSEWRYNQLPSGGLTFRQKLPLGSAFDVIGPCADGHFGALIKTAREWRLSGNTAWLSANWPYVKKSLDYIWSKDNPDQWDPELTGILSGRQHQTLDMELFGPNSWLGSMYVAALLAGAAMADAMGENELSLKCRKMAQNGAAYIDAKLFNGRYYYQAIDLGDKSLIEPFNTGLKAGVLSDDFMTAYWSDEHGEVKYQFGEGCIADQILGQWHAEISGLGPFLDPRKVKKALKSVFTNNYRKHLDDHFNPCRNYGFEDEGGLLLATYPKGTRQPYVAAPYAEELWTGIEYASASHMIMHGLVDEGLAVVKAVRHRYDGARRNPWNEIECGSYYARSMSAWQLVNAWAGFNADAVAQSLTFDPKQKGDFTLFWASGTAWGQLVRKKGRLKLKVIEGVVEAVRVCVAGKNYGGARLKDGDALDLG